MKKRRNRLFDILIAVLVSCFIGMISGGAAIVTMNYNKEASIANNTSSFEEIKDIYKKIMGEYYESVDEKDLVQGAISGMLSVLDANSSFLDESKTTSFNNKMQGEYYGIGIEALSIEDSGVLVVTVVKDSPAEKVGIKEGDIITKVNGVSLLNKTANYFTSLVASLKDNIKIKVVRDTKELDFTLSAEKIIIESVTTNTFYRNYKKVGYIKISVFAANTASQFATKLSELESAGIDSLIIDVRDNAGGYLSNVATILELFMKKDTILYKTEVKTDVTNRKDNTDDYRSYPVAILVNGSSASASEILAACFQDNYDSELIGTRTYGKGTVQETVSLSNGTMAKITTKKWLTPNGEWINGTGIEPTLKIDINESYIKNPIFENDNQLEKALDIIITK